MLVSRSYNKLFLDGVSRNNLAGQNAPVVYFPGTVFKGSNVLIQSPGFFCSTFYPTFGWIPFSGLDEYFY